jgi:hypothetical protein
LLLLQFLLLFRRLFLTHLVFLLRSKYLALDFIFSAVLRFPTRVSHRPMEINSRKTVTLI